MIATILHLAVPPTPDVLAALAKASEPASAGGPATPSPDSVSEPARTATRGFPIREDANVVVHLASYASADDWKAGGDHLPGRRPRGAPAASRRRGGHFLRHPPLL